MEFLADLDIARIVVALQGVVLLVLIVIRANRLRHSEYRFLNAAPTASWFLLVGLILYDTLGRILADVPHDLWWRSPFKAFAYGIGIAGIIYHMKRDKARDPNRHV